MKYMSVDIETTGLLPTIHGITEFAAVFADDQKPEQEVKTFYRWIDPEGYVWSTYCLSLHAKWIARVCERVLKKLFLGESSEPNICRNIVDCGDAFFRWYEEVDPEGFCEFKNKKRGNITGTGKNFGSFDLQFLKAWKFPDVFRHRTLDWIQTYQLPTDKVPPDLKMCKERAILMGCRDLAPEVAHNALEDAMDVHKLIQFGAQVQANSRSSVDDPRQ